MPANDVIVRAEFALILSINVPVKAYKGKILHPIKLDELFHLHSLRNTPAANVK